MSNLTVAVAGMGPMGRGIARVFREAGARVIVSDLTPEMTQTAVETIHAESLADGTPVEVESGTLEESLADADLFIEAIVEKMEAKASLLSQVQKFGRDDLIVASNTSSLSIAEMGFSFGSPERFVGLHFFNPPTKMKLVELIEGPSTDPAVSARVKTLGEEIGKTVVVCRDTPNFIVNRICRPLYYEAQLLVMQGVEPAVVDAAATGALRHPMGPLTLLDFTGIHTHLGSSETAYREFAEPKYRPIPLTKRLVRGGLTGRAAGRGYYDYAVEKPRPAIERVTSQHEQHPHIRVRWTGPDAPLRKDSDATHPDVIVYSCHRPARQSHLEEIAVLQQQGTVVIDSSDAAWLEVIPGGAEWARVHVTEERTFVEVVHDEVAGITPGPGIEALLQATGAQSVNVPALPGFVADRLANCMANEAYLVIEEGTASAADIDVALQLGMNHPRGPIAYAQSVGEERVYTGLRSMLEAFGDARYRPTQLLRRASAAKVAA